MKTLYAKNNYSTASSPATSGELFITPTSPEKTCADLTTELASSLTQKKIINQLAKVNKPTIMYLLPISCKHAILLLVKPLFTELTKRIPIAIGMGVTLTNN